MLAISASYNPPILKGLKVHPNNPFKFDFILDQGDIGDRHPERSEGSKGVLRSFGLQPQDDKELKQEANKLIKYFLASLTIPEKDLWVNLSPYEKDRIVPEAFGQTEMGRDLLAEDYILKQITSSLMFPEGETGKKFWKRVYQEAAKRFGTTNVPVNTFNKVWIVPDKAVVYENAKAGTAYVVESRLKVMLEEDYLAAQKYQSQPGDMAIFPVSCSSNKSIIARSSRLPSNQALNVKAPQGNDYMQNGHSNLELNPSVGELGSQVIREIIIPELDHEVNEGQNFAQLRQVYNSLILAAWYKKKIRDSILAAVYENKNKIKGLSYSALPTRGHGFSRVPMQVAKQGSFEGVSDPEESTQSPNQQLNPNGNPNNDVDQIYQQYLQAFKKGAYSYIKEEFDPQTQKSFPRKYFSGGIMATNLAGMVLRSTSNFAMVTLNHDSMFDVQARFDRAESADRLSDFMGEQEFIERSRPYNNPNTGKDPMALLETEEGRTLAIAWVNAFANKETQISLIRIAEIIDALARYRNVYPDIVEDMLKRFPDLNAMHEKYKAYVRSSVSSILDVPASQAQIRLYGKLIHGPNFLDIGAGSSYAEEIFLLKNPDLKHAIGVDIEGQKRVFDLPAGKTYEFRQMQDPLVIPINDGWANTTMLNFVLHHATVDHLSFLKEVYRTMAPGSKLIVLEDTFSDKLRVNPEDSDERTRNIFGLFSQLKTDQQRFAFLHFADWFTHNFINRSRDPLVPGNFRTMEDWKELFLTSGFIVTQERFLGLSTLGTRNPVTRGFFVLQKPNIPNSEESGRIFNDVLSYEYWPQSHDFRWMIGLGSQGGGLDFGEMADPRNNLVWGKINEILSRQSNRILTGRLLQGDWRSRFLSMLSHLTPNAVDAMYEQLDNDQNDKVQKVHIPVEIFDDGDQLRFVMRDTGIGIPEDVLQNWTNPSSSTISTKVNKIGFWGSNADGLQAVLSKAKILGVQIQYRTLHSGKNMLFIQDAQGKRSLVEVSDQDQEIGQGTEIQIFVPLNAAMKSSPAFDDWAELPALWDKYVKVKGWEGYEDLLSQVPNDIREALVYGPHLELAFLAHLTTANGGVGAFEFYDKKWKKGKWQQPEVQKFIEDHVGFAYKDIHTAALAKGEGINIVFGITDDDIPLKEEGKYQSNIVNNRQYYVPFGMGWLGFKGTANFQDSSKAYLERRERSGIFNGLFDDDEVRGQALAVEMGITKGSFIDAIGHMSLKKGPAYEGAKLIDLNSIIPDKGFSISVAYYDSPQRLAKIIPILTEPKAYAYYKRQIARALGQQNMSFLTIMQRTFSQMGRAEARKFNKGLRQESFHSRDIVIGGQLADTCEIEAIDSGGIGNLYDHINIVQFYARAFIESKEKIIGAAKHNNEQEAWEGLFKEDVELWALRQFFTNYFGNLSIPKLNSIRDFIEERQFKKEFKASYYEQIISWYNDEVTRRKGNGKAGRQHLRHVINIRDIEHDILVERAANLFTKVKESFDGYTDGFFLQLTMAPFLRMLPWIDHWPDKSEKYSKKDTYELIKGELSRFRIFLREFSVFDAHQQHAAQEILDRDYKNPRQLTWDYFMIAFRAKGFNPDYANRIKSFAQEYGPDLDYLEILVDQYYETHKDENPAMGTFAEQKEAFRVALLNKVVSTDHVTYRFIPAAGQTSIVAIQGGSRTPIGLIKGDVLDSADGQILVLENFLIPRKEDQRKGLLKAYVDLFKNTFDKPKCIYFQAVTHMDTYLKIIDAMTKQEAFKRIDKSPEIRALIREINQSLPVWSSGTVEIQAQDRKKMRRLMAWYSKNDLSKKGLKKLNDIVLTTAFPQLALQFGFKQFQIDIKENVFDIIAINAAMQANDIDWGNDYPNRPQLLSRNRDDLKLESMEKLFKEDRISPAAYLVFNKIKNGISLNEDDLTDLEVLIKNGLAYRLRNGKYVLVYWIESADEIPLERRQKILKGLIEMGILADHVGKDIDEKSDLAIEYFDNRGDQRRVLLVSLNGSDPFVFKYVHKIISSAQEQQVVMQKVVDYEGTFMAETAVYQHLSSLYGSRQVPVPRPGRFVTVEGTEMLTEEFIDGPTRRDLVEYLTKQKGYELEDIKHVLGRLEGRSLSRIWQSTRDAIGLKGKVLGDLHEDNVKFVRTDEGYLAKYFDFERFSEVEPSIALSVYMRNSHLPQLNDDYFILGWAEGLGEDQAFNFFRMIGIENDQMGLMIRLVNAIKGQLGHQEAAFYRKNHAFIDGSAEDIRELSVFLYKILTNQRIDDIPSSKDRIQADINRVLKTKFPFRNISDIVEGLTEIFYKAQEAQYHDFGDLIEDLDKVRKKAMEVKLHLDVFKPLNADSSRGGIDLTLTNIESQKMHLPGDNEEGIKFYLNPAMLAQYANASGFVPVIIDMHRLHDMGNFLNSPDP